MRICAISLFAVALATPALAAGPKFACAPANKGQKLVSLEIFDGPAADNASLVPDNSNQTNGVWTFSGTYEDGRFITLRCKYAGGSTIDIEMKQKVVSCKSREAGKVLSVACN